MSLTDYKVEIRYASGKIIYKKVFKTYSDAYTCYVKNVDKAKRLLPKGNQIVIAMFNSDKLLDVEKIIGETK